MLSEPVQFFPEEQSLHRYLQETAGLLRPPSRTLEGPHHAENSEQSTLSFPVGEAGPFLGLSAKQEVATLTFLGAIKGCGTL